MNVHVHFPRRLLSACLLSVCSCSRAGIPAGGDEGSHLDDQSPAGDGGAAHDGAPGAGDGAVKGPDGRRGNQDAAVHTTRDLRMPELPVLPTTKVMAFPGAEGFGADTPGGRGGKILEVTNLNDRGPGSLRAAVQASGPRIVVFRVSGTITIASDIDVIGPSGSNLTIAGQTSPGGVQIKSPPYGLVIHPAVHDVVMRHLRVRPGGPPNGMTDYTGGAILAYSTGDFISNLVVDHCSIEWGPHWMLAAAGNVTNVTYQWNIVAESVPPYGQALIIRGDPSGKMKGTFHHNLVAHGAGGQNPGISTADTIDFRNNLVYDWPGNNGGAFHNQVQINFVGNHYLPRSGGGVSNFLYGGAVMLFTEGNWGPLCPHGCANDWDNGFADADLPNTPLASESKYRAKAAFASVPVATQPAADVRDTVLYYAGATRPFRDSLDDKIVGDVLGNVAHSVKAVGSGGPWPVLTGPDPPDDNDHDGMADDWERRHGLDPADPKDGPAVSKSGYTNVENYLNELAGDPLP